MINQFILFLLFLIHLSLGAMDQEQTSKFPTLKNFCFTGLIAMKPVKNEFPLDRLPLDLKDKTAQVIESIGDTVTDTIENSIARRASNSFLLALYFNNKQNLLAQQLGMQILNKYPQDLTKNINQAIERYLFKNQEQDSENDFTTEKNYFPGMLSEFVLTILKIPSPDIKTKIIPQLLNECIQFNNEPAIRYLIDTFKIDINNDLPQGGLINYAAGSNNLVLAKLALDLGANVDNESRSIHVYPLTHAAMKGHHKMVTLLLNYGSIRSKEALLEMHKAIKNENYECNEHGKNILKQLCKKISPQEKSALWLELQNIIGEKTEKW